LAEAVAVDLLEPGDHVCWTFDDDERRLAAAARFVSAGIRARHKIVYVTDSLRPVALLAGLESLGVPVAQVQGDGRLQVVASEQIYRTGGRFDPDAVIDTWRQEIAVARREGRPGLRIITDMAWALRAGTSVPRLARYEARLNRVLAEGYAMALCQYDRRLFDAAELRLVAAAHPGTAGFGTGSGWVPLLRIVRTTDPPGLRLSGEVDATNRHALAAVLAGLFDDVADTDTRITIDMNELRFADTAAVHLLLRAAHASPAGLSLVGCRGPLVRLVDLVSSMGGPAEHAGADRLSVSTARCL
jgi:anti-anti-sigma regulatory factor